MAWVWEQLHVRVEIRFQDTKNLIDIVLIVSNNFLIKVTHKTQLHIGRIQLFSKTKFYLYGECIYLPLANATPNFLVVRLKVVENVLI